MRTATLIISLFAMCLILFQSCAAGVGGEMTGDAGTSEQAGVGIVVAFLYLIGGAFAIGVPMVSLVSFLLAAAFGIGFAAAGDFADLGAWGGVAIILAIFSFFGVREKRNS